MAESTTTAPAARESGDLGAPDGFAAGDQPAVLRDFGAFVETAADGHHRLNLLVEGVHCGGCVHKIESALKYVSSVQAAPVCAPPTNS